MSAPRRCSGLRGSLDGIGSQEGRGLLKAISFQLLSRQSSAVSNLGNGNAGWIGIGIGGEWMDEKDAYFFSHADDMGAVQCSTACTVDHSTMMMAVTFSLVSLSDEGHPTRKKDHAPIRAITTNWTRYWPWWRESSVGVEPHLPSPSTNRQQQQQHLRHDQLTTPES